MWVYGQLRKAQLEILSTAPTSPVLAQIYLDTTLGAVRVRIGGNWVNLGQVTAASGAGVAWFQPSGGPLETEENDQKVFLYEASRTQDLLVFYKVPATYTTGNQIQLNIGLYSPTSDGSSTIQFDAVSTLVRANSDPIDSSSLQHTKNAALITVTATANQFRNTEVDITDSAGKIAATAVVAGSMIKVQLRRGTDTDSADVRMIPSYSEFTF